MRPRYLCPLFWDINVETFNPVSYPEYTILRILEHGEVDLLYRNEGQGRFQPLSWTNGTFLDENNQPIPRPPHDWGLAAMFRDLNGDNAPDLYVCNDFESPDRIWLNDGHGRFRAVSAVTFRNTSTFSMAVDFADINRDGFDDLFLADMLDVNHQMRMVEFQSMEPSPMGLAGILERPQVNRNTLQLNRGDHTYAEIAYYAGLESSGWTWSCIFLDVDLDGYEDLLVATGNNHDVQDTDLLREFARSGAPPTLETRRRQIPKLPRLLAANVAFRNQGRLRFAEAGPQWGFDQPSVSQGMALGDLDNDGDLDVVLNNLNSAAAIYRNDSIAPRVAVRLRGRPPNTRGIGARIELFGGAVPAQSQEMICGGRYLSSDDSMRVFAAGAHEMRIEVRWRSGKSSVVNGVRANRTYGIGRSGRCSRRRRPRPTPRCHPMGSGWRTRRTAWTSGRGSGTGAGPSAICGSTRPATPVSTSRLMCSSR